MEVTAYLSFSRLCGFVSHQIPIQRRKYGLGIWHVREKGKKQEVDGVAVGKEAILKT
jgi:hypothetical protein